MCRISLEFIEIIWIFRVPAKEYIIQSEKTRKGERRGEGKTYMTAYIDKTEEGEGEKERIIRLKEIEWKKRN